MRTVTIDSLAEAFGADAPAADRTPQVFALRGDLQAQWARDGYVILPGFMPDRLVDAYARAWENDNGPAGFYGDRPGGYPYDTPYMHVDALRDLCCEPLLARILRDLIGEPMGVHLNLTGWRSTQRDWHQDGYLNPDHVADWYAAVWVALDDIHADSGPFEYVPGSHRRWPPIRQDRMLAALGTTAANRHWPTESEEILTPLFEDELRRTRTIPHQFIARKGDVLIWHARLLHRGSPPLDPSAERRAVIAHYSGIHHRPDMPAPLQHGDGGWYFPIDQGPVR